MKTSALFGWLSAIFGSLGTLICIAALAGVWIFCFQLRESVDRVFERVSTILTQVGEGSDEIVAGVQSSRQSVRELDQRIRDEVAKMAESANLEPEKIRDLTAQARLITQRLQDWRLFASSTRDFLGLVGELLDSAAVVSGSEDPGAEKIRTALENGQQQIGEAVSAFEKLVIQLENLQENRSRDAYEKSSKPLFSKIDGALGSVQEQTEAFSAEIIEFEQRSSDLGIQIQRWIFLGTFVVSLLFIWLGAGQVCLARNGYLKINPS